MSGESSGTLTLRRLTEEPSLQLAVIESGDLSTEIRSAHSIEIADAARWLAPGSVMLTTGLRFVGDPGADAAQARLVDELVTVGVAALLFGVGVHFDEVPQGLRMAARERGLPLLAVGAQTPFSTVEDYVNRGVLAAETYLLKRTVWLQNDLLHALSAANPVNALVVRLGALCKGTAVLYERSGRIVASAGHGPLRLIWEEVTARESAPQRFSVGQWSVAARPFLLRGSSFVLAIAARSASVLDSLGRDLLETAEGVLTAANAVRSLAMSEERTEAARLVTALRAGISTSHIRQTWDRLRQFRFRAGQTLRVVVASSIPARDRDDAAAGESLLEEAKLEDLPLLLAENSDADDPAPQLTALSASVPASDGWLGLLGRTHLTGVSGPFDDLTVFPRYFDEAATAWQLAKRRHDHGGKQTVIRLDEVDFASWLLTRRDDALVASRFDRDFGELVRTPDLADTVVTYLACNQDVKRTAQSLFVHPNTVRYRLRNIERMIGGPISSAKVVANLYLAFQDEILACSCGVAASDSSGVDTAARPASRRAIGTRYGEQET